jgi:hypothetical protein
MTDTAIERILSAPIEEIEADARLHAAPRHWWNDRCRWCLAETLVDRLTNSCSLCLGLDDAGERDDPA